MSPQLAAALLAWRRVQRQRWLKKGKPMPPWVFPSLEGTALEERNVRHVFKPLLEKAELRQIRIHDVRHTYAAAAGVKPICSTHCNHLQPPRNQRQV